eukprot:jgi/Antlo1/1452/2547
MHKEIARQQVQRLKDIRDRIVCDDREKVSIFSEELLRELRACIVSNNIETSKLGSEVIMLLSRSPKDEINAAIRSSGVVERLKMQFSERPHHFLINALRVILERDSHNTIENYNFFYAQARNRNHPRCIKDEIYRYFYNTHATFGSIDVKNLYKSKIGLLLLARAVNVNVLSVEHLRKLLKIFKKVDMETKIIIIESLEGLYQSYRIAKDERDVLVLTKILKLIQKIINTESNKCLILLSKIAENNLDVQKYVLKTGLLEKVCYLFSESADDDKILPSLFFCLYAISNESEESRKVICKSNILSQVFYFFNTKTISRSYDITFLAILYLFRSLTRSVQFLRSDLIDFPILDACINALESMKLQDTKMDIYTLMIKRTVNSYNIIDSLLAVISNLLLEYGNYKSFFYQKKALRVVIELVDDFPYSSLFLLKNFVYDSCWAIKEHFLQETEPNFFKNIFTKYKDNPKVIEQCLNLVRNLFCETDLELIILRYPDLLDALFCLFARNIKKKDDSVLIQLIYVFVNMATDKKFRREIIKNINIKYLMKNVEGRTARIATVWLITNLTWKEYEDGVHNVKFLKEIGVIDWLESIQCGDPVLDEKIKTAIENIA